MNFYNSVSFSTKITTGERTAKNVSDDDYTEWSYIPTVSIFCSCLGIVLSQSLKVNASKAEQNPQLKQLIWVNICPTINLRSDKKTPL